MSTQITIRLSEESAAYIDGLVADGVANSRAAAIDKIIRVNRRRREAERDLLRYLEVPPTPDENEWIAWGTAQAARSWSELD